MAVRVDRDWLLRNGIDPDLLARLLDDATVRAVADAMAAGKPAGRRRRSRGVLSGEVRLIGVTTGPGWWEAGFEAWQPASKNLKASHWSRWQKVRRIDNTAVALWAAHPDGPPVATGKRRVSCRVTRRRTSGRLGDPQNIEESLYDSLTVVGLLVDDSGRWCERGPTTIDVDGTLACKAMTTIRLEDIESP